MSDVMPVCAAIERPRQLFQPTATVHGLRVARTLLVGPLQVVDVWLYRDPPAQLADATLWELLPPPGAATVAIDSAVIDADHVCLTISGAPEPTRYRLQLNPPAGLDFDPLRLRLPVRLRPECPDLGNCFGADAAPAVPAQSPVHDYTARDWNALRRAMLEFHVRQHPDADLSVADPAVAVIELFAHLGDVLHYRLDRVGTEAYLATSRDRTSVRRHARLLDYDVADAVAAATTVHVSVAPGAGTVAVHAGDRVRPDDDVEVAFTIDSDLDAVDALGEIAVHDWGEPACCLPAGATSAVLVRPIPADPLGDAWVEVGDRLALEVVDPSDLAAHDQWRRRDPSVPWPQVGGNDGFRDPLPSRRAHVVTLTAVEALADPLAPTLALALVRWGIADALPRPYPVSADTERGAPEVTVVRGNLVAAHHGVLVAGAADETLQPFHADWALRLPATERLDDTPLGHLLIGASGLGLARRPDGTPHRLEIAVDLPTGTTVIAEPVSTHLGVSRGHLAVTVEEEDWRPPLLRFHTGAHGTHPPDGSVLRAVYEAGGGSRANLPANTLTVLERNVAVAGQRPDWQPVAAVAPRNPVAAGGGSDPEPLHRVRRAAPQAFAVSAERAVLPTDHAAAARTVAGIDRASATREWTGSWPLIRTVVDLLAVEQAEDPLGVADLQRVQRHLDGLRMIGQEVAVVAGVGVGLAIGLDVCLVPGTDAEAARRAILARLRPGTSEAPGFFHPDNLRLGGTIHTSAILAVTAAVLGVDAVEITTARRLVEPDGTVHAVLVFAQDEIPVLDDDPARPERGRIEITLRGGR